MCNRGVEAQAPVSGKELGGKRGRGNTTRGGPDISQIPAELVLPPVTTVAPCSLERAGGQAGGGGGSELLSRGLLLCR